MNRKVILFLTCLLFIVGIGIIGVSITYALNKQGDVICIYIDPGHGGFDGGTTSTDLQTIEKDITLKASLILKNYLEKSGFLVRMTRDTDKALANNKSKDIYKRVDLINESNATIYLTIHANAFPASSIHGAQTFYSTKSENNKKLAEIIMDKLRLVDASNKRSAKDISGKYLIDNVNKNGCLIELGFLSNQNDLAMLTNNEYLEKLTLMIYLGILEYIAGI